MTSAIATLDDSKLIEMALAGEVECFAALMDRHVAAVKKRILGMVRSSEDADDLLQEVQIKVWRHLSAFRSESSFRTWVMRVAINEVLQSYRREKRRAVCQPITDMDLFPSRANHRISLLFAPRPSTPFDAPSSCCLQSIGKS